MTSSLNRPFPSSISSKFPLFEKEYSTKSPSETCARAGRATIDPRIRIATIVKLEYAVMNLNHQYSSEPTIKLSSLRIRELILLRFLGWDMSDPSEYPLSSSFKLIEGYDVYRSSKLIMAFVVVEGDFGKDIRFYRWQKKKDAWKVDLARFSVRRWEWEKIFEKVKEMKEKYGIS